MGGVLVQHSLAIATPPRPQQQAMRHGVGWLLGGLGGLWGLRPRPA